MNYKRFIEITQKSWNDYFVMVKEKLSLGIINAKTNEEGKGEVLFPCILLITKTKKYYAAELLGASNNYQGLSVKSHNETSIARYLNQFNNDESSPLITLDGENISIEGLCISHYSNLEEVKSRFPFVNLFKTKLIHHPDAKGSLFTFTNNFISARIGNCLLVNVYLNSIRIKHILHLTVIHNDMLASSYEKWLKESLYDKKTFPGLHACDPEKGHNLTIASQFASAYLFYGLRETTIGNFLNQHPEIIQKAISTQKFIYEPYLKWIEKSPENKDETINPDLMIEREDGFYDIYDLKTALLDKKSLTKGERSRRRFIDYIEEGVAQLANYEEYFIYAKNCEYALNKYGIKVDKPNLVLVVGNFDNVNKTEIEEASRRLKNITIIDYDSFLQLFLLTNS
jgi:hypothetical protein